MGFIAVLLAGRCPAATAPYEVDASTIVLWRFDDRVGQTVTDSTGQHDGTAVGTAIVTGRFGYAREFAGGGTGEYVVVPDSPSLTNLSTITIEAWIYPTSFDLGVDNSREAILEKGDESGVYNLYGLSLIRNGSACCSPPSFTDFVVDMDFTNNASSAGAVSTVAHPPNQWYYLVGTYDGSVACVYVNGTREQCGTAAPGIKVTTTDLLFINNHTFFDKSAQSNGRFGGKIDEVRLSSTARNATDIAAIYQDALPRFLDFPLQRATNNSPGTASVSAVLDHHVADPSDAPQFYEADGVVTAFDGSSGIAQCGQPKCKDVVSKHSGLAGYKNTSGTAFIVSAIRYTGGLWLYYDGHSGYDFPSSGEPVIAPADGMLGIPPSDPFTDHKYPTNAPTKFYIAVISHEFNDQDTSGTGTLYSTWYLHMGCQGGGILCPKAKADEDWRVAPSPGCQTLTDLHAGLCTMLEGHGLVEVHRGDVIGFAGDRGVIQNRYHLHFEARTGVDKTLLCAPGICQPADPYGGLSIGTAPGGSLPRLWRE